MKNRRGRAASARDPAADPPRSAALPSRSRLSPADPVSPAPGSPASDPERARRAPLPSPRQHPPPASAIRQSRVTKGAPGRIRLSPGVDTRHDAPADPLQLWQALPPRHRWPRHC
jgi:hypothetical protein